MRNDDVARSIISPFGNDITLVSDRDEPNYTFSSNADFLSAFVLSFDQTDRNLSITDGEAYQRDGSTGLPLFLRTVAPLVDSQPLIYAQYGTLRYDSNDLTRVDLRCAFGVPTLATDLPSAATVYDGAQVNFRVEVSGPDGRITAAENPSFITTFDPEMREINLVLQFESAIGDNLDVILDLGPFAGTDIIEDGETNFGGSIIDESDNVIGEFNGWFFGPQGAELAISVNIETTDSIGRGIIATGVAFQR